MSGLSQKSCCVRGPRRPWFISWFAIYVIRAVWKQYKILPYVVITEFMSETVLIDNDNNKFIDGPRRNQKWFFINAIQWRHGSTPLNLGVLLIFFINIFLWHLTMIVAQLCFLLKCLYKKAPSFKTFTLASYDFIQTPFLWCFSYVPYASLRKRYERIKFCVGK